VPTKGISELAKGGREKGLHIGDHCGGGKSVERKEVLNSTRVLTDHISGRRVVYGKASVGFLKTK